MKDDIVKLTCPSCGGNQFTRKPNDFLECKYCGNTWKHKEDGRMEIIGYKRCKCGQLNSPESIYCQRCQSRLKINCPKFGTLADLEAIYCPKCMVNIDEALLAEHNSRIQEIEDTIAGKEAEIARLERQIQTIKQVSNKLCFWGKSGLTDEEKTVYSELNVSIGCLSPILLTILAISIMETIGRVVFLRSTISNLETVEQGATLLCLNFAAAVILGRLIAALILRDVRMNRVDQYCEPYKSQIEQYRKEINTLEGDRERANREYERIIEERKLYFM